MEARVRARGQAGDGLVDAEYLRLNRSLHGEFSFALV